MFRQMRWLAALVALAVTVDSARAQGHRHKFSIAGSGTATHVPLDGSSVSHPSLGVGTFIGLHHGSGDYRTVSFNPADLTFTFESAETYTFTARNGDKLVCTYGQGPLGPGMGFATPLPDGTVNAVFLAEFNPVGSECTGRFANASGSFLMLAFSTKSFVPANSPGPGTRLQYSWVGSGTLTVPGGG